MGRAEVEGAIAQGCDLERLEGSVEGKGGGALDGGHEADGAEEVLESSQHSKILNALFGWWMGEGHWAEGGAAR